MLCAPPWLRRQAMISGWRPSEADPVCPNSLRGVVYALIRSVRGPQILPTRSPAGVPGVFASANQALISLCLLIKNSILFREDKQHGKIL